MEKVTSDERFVLYVMRNRKFYKQSITAISKSVIMDKEDLHKILMSLMNKGYLSNEISKRDRIVKWIVKK